MVAHLRELKAQSMKKLNLIKYLSHPTTGCSRGVLLSLYKSLVRSIFDYGAPIYRFAPKSQLSILDPVQNAALRICTVPFRTSPALSLCSDAGIPPSEIPPPHSCLQLPDHSPPIPGGTHTPHHIPLPLRANYTEALTPTSVPF